MHTSNDDIGHDIIPEPPPHKLSVTLEDRVLYRMQHLISALQGTPSSKPEGKIMAIQELQYALNNWVGNMTHTNQEPTQLQALPRTKDKWDKRRYPRLQPTAPRVHIPYPRVHSPIQVVQPQYPRVTT